LSNRKQETMKYISDGIIAKYIKGGCSDQDIFQVENWKELDIKHKESLEMSKKILERDKRNNFNPDTEKALEKVLNRLPAQKIPDKKMNTVWYKVAGMIILLIGAIYLTLRYSDKQKIIQLTYYQNKYDKENIKLPDGSIIWMRKGSYILYPSKFIRGDRKIEFKGEGYFEVVGDKKNPFIVEAEGTITRVTGTKFSLNTAGDDSLISLILEEGLVEFAPAAANDAEFKSLLPGEKLSYSKSNQTIRVQKNQDMNYLSWKTKSYKFNNNTLDEIIQGIETLYDVRFGKIPDKNTKERYKIEFDSTFVLEQIIENLEIITETSIDKMDDIYYFKPNS